MSKVSDTKSFKVKASKVHGDKYDYSKVEYINSTTHVIIVCKIHGEFSQTPSKHLSKRGCQSCANISRSVTQRKTGDQFVFDAKAVHKERYDYSSVKYLGSQKNVDIICRIHGVFSQLANNHLNGEGCYKCGRISCGIIQKKLHETFLKECKEIHGEKYEYHYPYEGDKTKINIWCTIHKEYFSQRPNDHIKDSQGCPDCGILSMAKSQTKSEELYIRQVTELHNGLYNYDKLVYITTNDKVQIQCKKHGYFWQRASAHLSGQGCPHCGEWKSEQLCREIFEELFLFKFPKSRPEFLKRKEYDGFNEDLKIAFEYNGKQHYEYIPFFHKTFEEFESQKKRDLEKREISLQQGVILIEIPFMYNYQNPKKMYNHIVSLLKRQDSILIVNR